MTLILPIQLTCPANKFEERKSLDNSRREEFEQAGEKVLNGFKKTNPKLYKNFESLPNNKQYWEWNLEEDIDGAPPSEMLGQFRTLMSQEMKNGISYYSHKMRLSDEELKEFVESELFKHEIESIKLELEAKFAKIVDELLRANPYINSQQEKEKMMQYYQEEIEKLESKIETSTKTLLTGWTAGIAGGVLSSLADSIASSAIVGGAATTAVSGVSLALAWLAGFGAILVIASVGYMAYTCMESEKVENKLKELRDGHH